MIKNANERRLCLLDEITQSNGTQYGTGFVSRQRCLRTIWCRQKLECMSGILIYPVGVKDVYLCEREIWIILTARFLKSSIQKLCSKFGHTIRISNYFYSCTFPVVWQDTQGCGLSIWEIHVAMKLRTKLIEITVQMIIWGNGCTYHLLIRLISFWFMFSLFSPRSYH